MSSLVWCHGGRQAHWRVMPCVAMALEGKEDGRFWECLDTESKEVQIAAGARERRLVEVKVTGVAVGCGRYDEKQDRYVSQSTQATQAIPQVIRWISERAVVDEVRVGLENDSCCLGRLVASSLHSSRRDRLQRP